MILPAPRVVLAMKDKGEIDMTTLYWGPHTCAIGIHVLLEEIGAPYDTVEARRRRRRDAPAAVQHPQPEGEGAGGGAGRRLGADRVRRHRARPGLCPPASGPAAGGSGGRDPGTGDDGLRGRHRTRPGLRAHLQAGHVRARRRRARHAGAGCWPGEGARAGRSRRRGWASWPGSSAAANGPAAPRSGSPTPPCSTSSAGRRRWRSPCPRRSTPTSRV